MADVNVNAEVIVGLSRLKKLQEDEFKEALAACERLQKALEDGDRKAITLTAGELIDFDYGASDCECFQEVLEKIEAAGLYDDEAYVSARIERDREAREEDVGP